MAGTNTTSGLTMFRIGAFVGCFIEGFAATIEQLSKIAKNKQNNKRAALLPPTVTKLTKVPIIVSHSGLAYKAAKKRFQALSTGNIKEYMRSHEGFV